MKKIVSKLDNAVISVKNRAAMALSKKEDGSHLLEVLGTIIIAIVILILFKDKIVEIFNDALGKTTEGVSDLFN